MTKMTSNELSALKIVLTEPQRNTEQNALLISEDSILSSHRIVKTILAVILLTIALRHIKTTESVKQCIL